MTRDCNHPREIEDHPVPGGCDQCEAMQELIPSVIYADIFYLTIRHAEDCPVPALVRASRWN